MSRRSACGGLTSALVLEKNAHTNRLPAAHRPLQESPLLQLANLRSLRDPAALADLYHLMGYAADQDAPGDTADDLEATFIHYLVDRTQIPQGRLLPLCDADSEIHDLSLSEVSSITAQGQVRVLDSAVGTASMLVGQG